MKKAIGFLPALMIAAMPLLGANAAALTSGAVGADATAAVNAAANAGSAATGASNTAGSVTTGVNGTVTGATNAGSNTSGSANAGVNAGVNGSSNPGSSVNSNGSVSVNADLGANAVVMSRSDISGDSSNGSAMATLTRASSVSTSDDLRAFARGSMQNDANLRSEAFSDSKVEVSHDVRGRFIGLFPVTVTAKANVDASGNVSVDYPWYAFLVSKDKASLEASIRARLSADGFSNGASRTTLTASEQARIAEDVRSAMRDSLNGSASANAAANGSVSGSSN